jgi:hypothetical protein
MNKSAAVGKQLVLVSFETTLKIAQPRSFAEMAEGLIIWMGK